MKMILCIGQEWKGSNASGLFYAIGSLPGYMTHIVDVKKHISLSASGTFTKVLNKLIRSAQVYDYNSHIEKLVKNINPDLVFVYKGQYLRPELLEKIKTYYKVPLVLFYPDISYRDQGPYIYETLKYYDSIYSTKSFGFHELDESNIDVPFRFVPHGADTLVHRKLGVRIPPKFQCDVSFTGSFSKKKMNVISTLDRSLSHSNTIDEASIKVWGNGWVNSMIPDNYKVVKIQGYATAGDSYVASINGSRINLGILYEGSEKTKFYDKITSRTFHIPACGGFMIHERSEELADYFEEDKEIVCYSSNEELSLKCKYYLENENERLKIAQKGYERSQRDHTLIKRAEVIFTDILDKGLLS